MWMNSDFASWEVEGQVNERVGNAMKDAENWRTAHQALNAKGFPERNRLWKSAIVAYGWITRFSVRIDRFLDKSLLANRNQKTDWSAIGEDHLI